jgi:hypothetical protein
MATAKPVNRILSGPEWVEITEWEVGANATAAQMVPGRFVIDDTTDGDVKEAGAKADNVLGVLEVNSSMLVTDAYAVGDACNVIMMPGARVVLIYASGGAAISPGDCLVTAANGKVVKQAVGAMGAQGSVVARALESDAGGDGDSRILAVLVMGCEPAASA